MQVALDLEDVTLGDTQETKGGNDGNGCMVPEPVYDAADVAIRESELSEVGAGEGFQARLSCTRARGYACPDDVVQGEGAKKGKLACNAGRLREVVERNVVKLQPRHSESEVRGDYPTDSCRGEILQPQRGD